jgi:hypothetical protein
LTAEGWSKMKQHWRLRNHKADLSTSSSQILNRRLQWKFNGGK